VRPPGLRLRAMLAGLGAGPVAVVRQPVNDRNANWPKFICRGREYLRGSGHRQSPAALRPAAVRASRHPARVGLHRPAPAGAARETARFAVKFRRRDPAQPESIRSDERFSAPHPGRSCREDRTFFGTRVPCNETLRAGWTRVQSALIVIGAIGAGEARDIRVDLCPEKHNWLIKLPEKGRRESAQQASDFGR
jgi:hypothetical protein